MLRSKFKSCQNQIHHKTFNNNTHQWQASQTQSGAGTRFPKTGQSQDRHGNKRSKEKKQELVTINASHKINELSTDEQKLSIHGFHVSCDIGCKARILTNLIGINKAVRYQ